MGYAEFGDWYDDYRRRVLEPAMDAASDQLDAAFDDLLSDRDLARIRNATGRVKSKRRTWRKIRQPRYAERITSVDDIPAVIDDLIGLRITCTNLRDIEMVQSALEALPRTKGPSLWLDPASERDYVVSPKPSGYRGWHVNLGVTVNVADGRLPMMCELQVRTLLQDSWGELTHEETYAKDGALPPLVEVLSKRMADLFSTLDDIAEDLRTELDRIDEEVAAAPVESTGSSVPLSGIAADAADVLLDRWRAIDRPTDMGSLAWALQREFGAEVSDDWFGHGSFKRFLQVAVPDGEISTGDKAYLLPLAEPESEEVGESRDAGDFQVEMPSAITELRRVDQTFPLLETDQWANLYAQLAAAWQEVGPRSSSQRALHELTKTARDRADAAGVSIARRHFEHVASVVLGAEETDGSPQDASVIAERFSALTIQRMLDLRIVGRKNGARRAAVAAWLAT